MEQLLPILVSRRLPESYLRSGDTLPPYEQKVVALALTAPLKLVRNITGHGRDDDLRFTESQFKRRGLPSSDLQGCGFKNHSQ
jgi:hypothetical protein